VLDNDTEERGCIVCGGGDGEYDEIDTDERGGWIGTGWGPSEDTEGRGRGTGTIGPGAETPDTDGLLAAMLCRAALIAFWRPGDSQDGAAGEFAPSATGTGTGVGPAWPLRFAAIADSIGGGASVIPTLSLG